MEIDNGYERRPDHQKFAPEKSRLRIGIDLPHVISKAPKSNGKGPIAEYPILFIPIFQKDQASQKNAYDAIQ